LGGRSAFKPDQLRPCAISFGNRTSKPSAPINRSRIPHSKGDFTKTIKNLTLRLATALLLAAPATATITATPAHAFFGGFGRIVYDAQKHAENIGSAARALEQINNQITPL
jgi:hypothetical protein